jgi:hypothetical protein
MTTGSDNGEKHRERRRFDRKEVFGRQLITVELGEGRAAILIDISEDGIAVQPIRPLKLGTRLKLDFPLPTDAGYIRGQGEVVWVSRNGRAGIRFSHLTQRAWCEPIFAETQIIAGIVALSAKKDAFAERDASRLKRLAEIASRLAEELRAETAGEEAASVDGSKTEANSTL